MTRSSAGILLLTILLTGCGQKPTAEEKKDEKKQALAFPLERTTARMQRGQYLVTAVVSCFDCHSERQWKQPDAPPKPGMMGAGDVFPLDGLPGRLVASNITPDPETGMGNATDEDFYKAMTQGIGKDGRTLFPLMPYAHLRELGDEDLASIIVYVRSVPAVRHELPKTELIPPVKQSLKPLPPRTPGAPPPDVKEPVHRGGYLANAAGCTDCHTPADRQGVPMRGMDFGGGFVMKGPWGTVASANITPDPSGVPYYDQASFVEMMHTGKVKGSRKLNVLMPVPFYRNMTDEDLQALFAWMRSLRPVKHRVDNAETPTLCRLCNQRHGLGSLN